MVRRTFSILWRLVVSLAVSGVVLALLFRLAGGQEDAARRVIALVMDASVLGIWISLAAMFAQTLLRAVRYRLLVAAADPARTPGLPALTLVTMARNMFVDVLPARLGELIYAGMLNRGCGVSGAACFSSMSVSILFDLGALFLVLAGALAARSVAHHRDVWLLPALAMTLLAASVAAVVLFRGIDWAVRLLARSPAPRAFLSLKEKMVRALGSLSDALRLSRRRGVLGRVLILSVAIRLFKYGGMAVLFRSVSSTIGSLMDAGIPEIIMGLIGAEGAASLPVPAFMSFGAYEAGGAAAWTALGFPAADAAAAMLALHIWSQLLDYGTGGLAVMLFFFTVRPGASSRAGRRPSWSGVALVTAALFAAVCIFGVRQHFSRKRGAAAPPPVGESVTPAVLPALPATAGEKPFEGFIVWSSNRGGNHDIYRMDLPGGAVRWLTNHPHTDYYPRISPDGTQIVFCRSQIPWVSQRNPVPWDVYRLDLVTGAETLVAANANAPVWSAGGRRVIFQRAGHQCVEKNLKSGDERVLFDIAPDIMLESPSWSDARQTLAVTLRGRRRATGLISPGGVFRRVGGGCQLFWAPDSSYLFYVDSGGRQKNAFFKVDSGTLERSLWLDMPGGFSHEYFPALSQDGRWLVFAASAGGHEPDSADYEIFLWRAGSPPESAARLTFHTGNDCWPDIHAAAE